MESKILKMRPERFRISLWDDAGGSTPLELPSRRMWPIGLIFAAMFAIFAGIAWTMMARMSAHGIRDVFDLMFFLFEAFWLLGWSVGVAILAVATIFFFLYGESARLHFGQLVYVPRLGPLKIIIEYDLARMRNVRLENAGRDDKVRIRFDYGEGTNGLGDAMPRADAEPLLQTLQSAAAAAGSGKVWAPAVAAREVPRPEPAIPPPQAPEPPPPSLNSLSGLALIGANLIPLAGVLFFGWDLSSVLVLFWAESAVIGFYTALKMAVVGKLAAMFAVPFFIGHFGGFMAGHFLLIYSLFVRGPAATGLAPGAREALVSIFMPLWMSLAALFFSHGVSFCVNFLGRREYAATSMTALMAAPYNRIVVMQLALIFGGWIVLLLKSPVPALALLVVLKTAMDFAAHRKEHSRLG